MRKTNCNLTRERLQEVLDYDPDTGIFRWKVSPARNVKLGAVAGYLNNQGYRMVEIDHKAYPSHRLAWLYQTGDWPTNLIDHINGIRTDNRFFNLREATRSQNNQNSQYSWGKSRYRGVSWSETAKKMARTHNG